MHELSNLEGLLIGPALDRATRLKDTLDAPPLEWWRVGLTI